MKTILITGTTGNVGSGVVKALQERSVRALEAVTDLERPKPHLPAYTERIRFDFGEDDSYVPAFQGVDTVCLLRPLLSVPVTFHLGPASMSWTPVHKRNPQ